MMPCILVYALCPFYCFIEHLSTWEDCLAAVGFLRDRAAVLRYTAKETFCRYQYFGWDWCLGIRGSHRRSLVFLKMEAAHCNENLAPKLLYIPEEWAVRNITFLRLRFGLSSSFLSALKIVIFIVTSFGRLATSIRIANAYLYRHFLVTSCAPNMLSLLVASKAFSFLLLTYVLFDQ